MHTPICDEFGIEFPIFAFSHCRDVVAAVSRAGGLGVLGALYFTPERLEIELSWIDELGWDDRAARRPSFRPPSESVNCVVNGRDRDLALDEQNTTDCDPPQ